MQLLSSQPRIFLRCCCNSASSYNLIRKQYPTLVYKQLIQQLQYGHMIIYMSTTQSNIILLAWLCFPRQDSDGDICANGRWLRDARHRIVCQTAQQGRHNIQALQQTQNHADEHILKDKSCRMSPELETCTGKIMHRHNELTIDAFTSSSHQMQSWFNG